jgi:GH15 family glucan-1,4-alpha-glucosidase
MLREGQVRSCERFLAWVNKVVISQRSRVERVLTGHRKGLSLDAHDYLPTRYHLDGTLTDDDWPNFQIDGYGAWLWLLAEYVGVVGDETILHRYRESIRLTLDYLTEVWQLPNYDCWEEYGDAVHPSTLACIYGGVSAINDSLGEKALALLADRIRSFALGYVVDGRFKKNSWSDSVEASLLWLSVPFDVVQPQDELMRRTVRAIEEELLEKGGLRRYPEDTYFGGGLWILLGCWLGWYYVRIGRREKAERIARWVEAQADECGDLPEQVPGSATVDRYQKEWEERWGGVARPLLWSHAMYLILRRELAES